MRLMLTMGAAMLLVGCASSVMQDARLRTPDARMDSAKQPVQVAQCIQYSWQDERTFGVDASGYLEAREAGVYTVHVRDADAFVDVRPHAGGSQIDFYARQQDGAALQRRATAATCL